MIAVLVFALALAAVMLAVGIIASAWQRYGALVLSARQNWLDCPETREVRFQLVQRGLTPGGNIVVLPFKPKVVLAQHPVPLRPALLNEAA